VGNGELCQEQPEVVVNVEMGKEGERTWWWWWRWGFDINTHAGKGVIICALVHRERNNLNQEGWSRKDSLRFHNAALIPKGRGHHNPVSRCPRVCTLGRWSGHRGCSNGWYGSWTGKRRSQRGGGGRWCSGLVTVCAMWLQQHSRHGKERSRPREPRLIPV